jgi:hypothetical protein
MDETTQTGNEPKYKGVTSAVADQLHSAADALRKKVEASGASPTVTRYGRQASSMLDSSADYVRSIDLERVDRQIRDEVRRNPGRSLMIAGAIGLFAGVLIRGRR